MQDSNSYGLIKNRIYNFKKDYPYLQNKSDDYVFSAVAVQAIFYQNPALQFSDQQIIDDITDSKSDGGIDILLIDPNSEEAPDLVIGQGKFYTSISKDNIYDAIEKMYRAFNDLESGKYEEFNTKIQSKFTSLYPDIGDESKINFYFYTSAPQKGIRKNAIIEKIKRNIFNSDKYDIKIYFSEDIEREIKEFTSRRDYIESGKINIDAANNFLKYNDAVIINASAFSLKDLYANHGKNLLAKNLRYHVKGPSVDKDIKNTIENDPFTFWYKNNGITVICEDFEIDGTQVKLKNFSIINGAQTTHMIGKSKSIDKYNNIYLPCKIIKSNKDTSEENEDFIFEIAIATNSQKPIKQSDLKANAPEQIHFKDALREYGIYYQTKRGESIPPQFKICYLNTKLAEVGKLYLAAIFQMPGTSRSKPSSLYNEDYYDKVFHDSQNRYKIAKFYRELLYINYYYSNKFLIMFENEYKNTPSAEVTLSFAKNARTLCIAFVTLASRYYYKSISGQDLKQLFDSLGNSDGSTNAIAYNIFTKNIGMINNILPGRFEDKDKYDESLYNIFKYIINAGAKTYGVSLQFDKTLNATNYLKKDKNYYSILSINWNDLEEQVKKTFSDAESN